MAYSRDFFVRDEYGRSNRCSCVGIIVALVVIVILVMLPSILEGSTIFIIGDPVLYLLSLVTIYGPILICVVVIKVFLDRRKRKTLAEM
jgi:hypothetical protein